MKKRISKHLGFTLLELICVVGVIFFLFALLMPALSKAKRISTRVVCGSNMKSFYTVCDIYLNDNDQFFPSPTEWLYSLHSNTPEHPIGCRWHDWPMASHGEIMRNSPAYKGMMSEYVEDISGAICPDFRDYAKTRGCENFYHNPAIDIKPQFNYSMNAYLGSEIIGSAKNMGAVYQPAARFLFAEENSWSLRPDHPKYPVSWLNAPLSMKALDDSALLVLPTPQAENCFATFHNASSDLSDGFGNLAYLDGHTDTISANEQLRDKMHGQAKLNSSRYGYSRYESSHHPAGNLYPAWPLKEPPPGGWESQ